MQDHHRLELQINGIGTWVLNAPRGQAEFTGQNTYVPAVRGNIWKFFEGGSKPKFIDPQRRFVLLDAQDEILRGDAALGELRTVATLKRAEDPGLRHSVFISAGVPVFIFERGLVVFDSDGQLRWSHNDLKLDDHFKKIENGRIFYSAERQGTWAYDLSTGELAGRT